jgi:hypothetical protein
MTINWKKRRAQDDPDHGICYLENISLPHTVNDWQRCMDCIWVRGKEVQENTNDYDQVGVWVGVHLVGKNRTFHWLIITIVAVPLTKMWNSQTKRTKFDWQQNISIN